MKKKNWREIERLRKTKKEGKKDRGKTARMRKNRNNREKAGRTNEGEDKRRARKKEEILISKNSLKIICLHWTLMENLSNRYISCGISEVREMVLCSRYLRGHADPPADLGHFGHFGGQFLLQVDDLLGDASTTAAVGRHRRQLVDAGFEKTNRLVLLLAFRAQTLSGEERRQKKRGKMKVMENERKRKAGEKQGQVGQ